MNHQYTVAGLNFLPSALCLLGPLRTPLVTVVHSPSELVCTLPIHLPGLDFLRLPYSIS